jgi:hypothetical protein
MQPLRTCYRAYWYNYITEATSVNVPAELPAEVASELDFDAGTYYYNTITNKASWNDPTDATWREVTDPNGRKFWYHPQVRCHTETGCCSVGLQ